jgi:hypothetical protein
MIMTTGMILFVLAMVVLAMGLFVLHIYGAVLGFRKKWYIGLLALVFGQFGLILGAAKFFFKTDLLK